MEIFPPAGIFNLEVNGRKLAVVEGYKAHSARESHYVEAFGSAEPVGTVPGKTQAFCGAFPSLCLRGRVR